MIRFSRSMLMPLVWMLPALGLAEQWIPLFNGKDLKDWTPKFAGHESGKDSDQVFRVEDGLLKVSYQKLENFDGSFGHLFYKTPFSHYVNGKEVLRYQKLQLDDGKPLTSGYIAIQAETHPTEFRKIELLPLEGNQSAPNSPPSPPQ